MGYDQRKIVEALRAFESGEIVVVTDDDGRENEGDLIVAAGHCTPEKMAFIVRHTSGIVCTPMPREQAKRFNLTAMVAENDAPHSTAFTVSVDASTFWSIHRWIDFKTTEDATWSLFKGKFGN